MQEWDEAAIRGAYDEIADAYADHFPSTEPEQPVDLAMVEHFVAALGPDPLVLDAGCGAGRMMPFLAGLGCRIEGVDLSPGMVLRAQADHGQFPSRVASLTELPYASRRFDGVFSWYSTIHVSDDEVAIIVRELARVLKDGGLLLVAFQTGQGVRDAGLGFRERGYDLRLLRYHRSAARMGRALRRGGFSLIASLDRVPTGSEAEGQAVLIGRRGDGRRGDEGPS